MDGILDRFPRLNVAGKTRPHGRYKPRRTSEQAPFVVTCQHYHNRIGARKMLGLASRAVAPPAATDKLCCAAAVRAKAMARVPVQHGLCLGNRREMVGGDTALYSNRAEVGYVQPARL